MQIGLVTLLPEMFAAITDYGITGRAVRGGLIDLQYWNPRDFTADKHRTVDDKPFGGGPGMLMKTEPLVASITAAKTALASKGHTPKVIYLSPQGRTIDQQAVLELSARNSMVMVCGRYQGIDARVIESEIDEEWSLGDFVLSGGELAAMALIDALTRYQQGALGDIESAKQDSFATGLLHSPQYTRPQQVAGQSVPDVLLSGNHQAIRQWQMQHSLGTTWLKRPDLLTAQDLSEEQQTLLQAFIDDYKVTY